MKKMYDILLNMKDRFSEEDWLMMVEQAHSKGKITGKKQGTTTIIAHLKDGKTLKCKVTIKPNEYTAPKITMADVGINEYTMRAYHATYQKKEI